MHRILFIIALLLATYGVSRAQDFNYTVSTDSVAWNELNAQTILNANNSAWNFSYTIPIGFTFSFCGRTFDSLTIETNGYIVFDRDRNYAITAFSGVGDHVDGNGNHAVLGYELSGTAGDRVLKIQYKNCGESMTSSKCLSWQIWLKENGTVEFRIGPGSLRYKSSGVDETQNYRLGFLNMNLDGEENGVMIYGSPDDPDTQQVDHNNPDTPFLDAIPASGYRYIFTPSN